MTYTARYIGWLDGVLILTRDCNYLQGGVLNRYKFIVIYSLLTKMLFWFSSSPLKFGSRVLIVKDVSLTPNLNQMEPLGEKSRVKFATVR